MRFTKQGGRRRYAMRKIPLFIFLGVLLATAACKKKIGVSEAVKADLKNYLTVELPKSAPLFKLVGAVTEKYKEGETGGGTREKGENDLATLSEGITALQKVTTSTEDVKRVHAQLQEGVQKLEVSFKKLEEAEKKNDPMAAMSGILSIIGDVMKGIKSVNDWNDDLEAGCKANGLENEFKEFQEKYGLKAK